MASRPTAPELKRMLDRMEPRLAAAFREVIDNITSNVSIGALEEALRLGDVQAAIQAIGAGSATYTPLTEAVRSAYLQGGMMYADFTPKSIKFGFDVNNPRAQNWIQRKGAEMVTIMEGEQRDVIQSAVREVVGDGVTAGQNPRKMALDLAGRVDRSTGRRVGGRIALTNQQAQAVSNAASELRQNTPSSISKYLSKAKRDKRFDGIVKRALESGEALSQQDVNRITGRYSDRLLQHRAEMIARTETNKAFQEAADESLRQLVEGGHVKESQIIRVWDSTMDMRTRPSHSSANGQRRGLNQPFDVGGYQMRHPLDGSLGAPASEIVACRCFMRQEIDYLAEGLDGD